MKLRNICILILTLTISIAGAAELKWAKDLPSALKMAKAGKKLVMVDFTAVWCVNCHKLDRTTYKDAAVIKSLGNVVPVKVDYDKSPAIAKKYKVEALPVILFLDANGKEVGRISKYVDAKEFAKTATPILKRPK